MGAAKLVMAAVAAGIALYGAWVLLGSEDASRPDSSVEPSTTDPVEAPDEPAALTAPGGDARGSASGPRGDALPGERSPSQGVADLLAYGRLRGVELDFVKPWPDAKELEKLRAIVVTNGIDCAALRDAALALDEDDPGRVALVAGAAWAGEPSEETDLWLRGVATDWSELGVTGEQAALAAVLAMDLSGREDALEDAATELLELSGGDEDSPSFPGLASVRTWHALRGLRRVDSTAWDGRWKRWFVQDSPDRRVNEELWALAARSSSEWREAVLGRALDITRGPQDQRMDAVLGGVEVLSTAADDTGSELEQLAESTAAGWLATAASKAIVRDASEAGLTWLTQRLGGDVLAREQALEALRSWRSEDVPSPTLGHLAALRPRLDQDEDAVAALAKGMGRAIERLRFRADETEKTAAADALASAAAAVPEDSPWAEQLARWTRELRATH